MKSSKALENSLPRKCQTDAFVCDFLRCELLSQSQNLYDLVMLIIMQYFFSELRK